MPLSIFKRLINKLPRRCLLCEGNTTLSNICQPCQSNLSVQPASCQLCALPLPVIGSKICGPCLVQPPPWHYAISVFPFEPPIDNLLHRLKYGADLMVGQTLGEMMVPVISARCQTIPQLLIPLPLHWRRFYLRGFNQSVELAKPIAAAFEIPLGTNVLRRARFTQEQTGLRTAARIANVRGAFSAAKPVEVTRVALIDDVMTTGSTLQAASRALIGAGVKHLQVWTCARAQASRFRKTK